jgi:hypothetical protein
MGDWLVFGLIAALTISLAINAVFAFPAGDGKHFKGSNRPRGTYMDELDRVMSENRRKLRQHPAPWGPNPFRHKQKPEE